MISSSNSLQPMLNTAMPDEPGLSFLKYFVWSK